jgi:hypothetical protein
MGLISVAAACRFAVEVADCRGGVAAGIFLIVGWYYRELHEKPHPLSSDALIEIKVGDMAGLRNIWHPGGLGRSRLSK